MKNLICTVCLIAITTWVFCQNSVGIGTTTPDSSAILDITSTDRGVLVPRLTTAQREMIVTAGQGLLLYDTDTKSYWFHNTETWVELIDKVNTEVHRNGQDMIYLGLTDSVGIGTTNPTYKLQVNTVDANYGISHTNGIVDLATFVDTTYGGWIGTRSLHPFNLYAGDQFNQFMLLPNGNIGIGLSTPANRFDILHANPREGVHPVGLPLYVTGNIGHDSNGIEFRHFNGSQGIGFGFNTIYAAGSNPDQNIGILAKGSLGNIILSTMGTERMRINPDGKVGIGTTSSSEQLHIYHGDDPTILIQSNGIDEPSGKLSLRQSNFTGIDIFYDGVQSVDALVFETFQGGVSSGRKMTLDLAGNVGIGITENIAVGHKLSVNGKIACTEVRVQPQSAWPDYVFAPEYNLMSLDELHASIALNRHLPGIPSAAEVHANGLQLGDMQSRTMEKVEELTLYLLQLHHEIKILRQQNHAIATHKCCPK